MMAYTALLMLGKLPHRKCPQQIHFLATYTRAGGVCKDIVTIFLTRLHYASVSQLCETAAR